jgi:hypothetical protein
MAGDPRLYTPRAPLYTSGYTAVVAVLQRMLEDKVSRRTLEGGIDYRVAERNTTLA